MDLIQTFRILGQQMKSWDYSFDSQYAQMPLIKKLYLKNGLEIKLITSACPEQYEIFKDGKQVGYYRLRHGEFTVDYPDAFNGEELLTVWTNGDGIFDSDERLKYLTKAMRLILEKIKSHH